MDDLVRLFGSQDFYRGALVMGILMLFLLFYAAYLRAESLYLSHKAGTPTKLGKKFYYIVEESEYNRLKIADLPQFGENKEEENEHIE
jgi:hypothetical protein